MAKYLSHNMKEEKDDTYYLLLALKALYAVKVNGALPAESTDISVEAALLVWNKWADRLALMNNLAAPFGLEFYLMEESGHYYLTLDIPGQTAPDQAEV